MKKLPRGIRNNNPGNIRHGADWKGLAEDQPDSDFCTFTAPRYGIRAMARILMNYQRIHNLQTVRQIINRWAPPSENKTDAYVDHVAKVLGVDPDQHISVQQHVADLVAVIIEHENGMNPYDLEVILEGVGMAQA